MTLADKQSAVKKLLPHFDPLLQSEIAEHALYKDIPGHTEILQQGQYVKVVPLVLKGLIKVFTRFDDKELLLYYIQPRQSCIMSFSAIMQNEPSEVYASTEEDTQAILLPVSKINGWVQQFPDINQLFLQQYKQRYSELLDTIQHVLFQKMDVRLLNYLQEKATLTGQNPLSLSHRQIAQELGTAREVVSRVMKKLETNGWVKQHTHGIEVLKK